MLISDDFSECIREVNYVRESLGSRATWVSPEALAELVQNLKRTRYLRHQPIVQAFINDAQNFSSVGRLVETKLHINERRDNQIFSLFNASYFPALSLDHLFYDALPSNDYLVDRYASNTLPVNMTQMSQGFQSRVVVALFPENHLDGSQDDEDLIFYFIDKFVERHQRITRKLISSVMAEGSFPNLRNATKLEVEQASSWWVHLHEYHHRHGDMPIPNFLSAKSSKPLAGLEELRVDVSAMLVCLHDEDLSRREATLTFEYILAERLLRYAVEGIPRPNYDAVASQLLFKYLTEHGGISLKNGRIKLLPPLPIVLYQFLGEITGIEKLIHHESVDQVRTRLLSFTNDYTDFDPEAKDYRHIPFFAEIKEKLEV
ncbi:DUF6421 family protein [Streptomyces fildesensis]|uniref:DUF6421 family protein n=1 Tax=Streptomyces fildesensis TaxID=375757 RepID=UPI0018DF3BD5|nr:DUF6421 family protein [Streptomyces fildesensis]